MCGRDGDLRGEFLLLRTRLKDQIELWLLRLRLFDLRDRHRILLDHRRLLAAKFKEFVDAHRSRLLVLRVLNIFGNDLRLRWNAEVASVLDLVLDLPRLQSAAVQRQSVLRNRLHLVLLRLNVLRERNVVVGGIVVGLNREIRMSIRGSKFFAQLKLT